MGRQVLPLGLRKLKLTVGNVGFRGKLIEGLGGRPDPTGTTSCGIGSRVGGIRVGACEQRRMPVHPSGIPGSRGDQSRSKHTSYNVSECLLRMTGATRSRDGTT